MASVAPDLTDITIRRIEISFVVIKTFLNTKVQGKAITNLGNERVNEEPIEIYLVIRSFLVGDPNRMVPVAPDITDVKIIEEKSILEERKIV